MGATSRNNEEEQVQKITKLAEQLSPAQRKQLLAELSLQGQASDLGDTRDLDMWAGSIYSALVASNGGGSGGVPGPAIVKRAVASNGAWGYVRGFMEDAGFDKLKVVERQTVYKLLADMVVQQAKHVSYKSNAPLSPKLVANCSVNVSGLFEQSFPGYLRAGLAHIVARRALAGSL